MMQTGPDDSSTLQAAVLLHLDGVLRKHLRRNGVRTVRLTTRTSCLLLLLRLLELSLLLLSLLELTLLLRRLLSHHAHAAAHAASAAHHLSSAGAARESGWSERWWLAEAAQAGHVGCAASSELVVGAELRSSSCTREACKLAAA